MKSKRKKKKRERTRRAKRRKKKIGVNETRLCEEKSLVNERTSEGMCNGKRESKYRTLRRGEGRMEI